jgi:hypothetical protein
MAGCGDPEVENACVLHDQRSEKRALENQYN